MTMGVDAGELRHRVTLQTAATAADAGGGGSVTWSNTATVWAMVEPLSAREQFHADQLRSPISHRIIMRYRSDVTVTAAMRISFSSRLFNIRGVRKLDEINQWIEVMAEEDVGQ